MAKVADEVRVDGGDENTGISQTAKDGLVIAAGAFHDGPSITVKGEDVILETIQFAERVSHIKGVPEGNIAGMQDRHSAFTL